MLKLGNTLTNVIAHNIERGAACGHAEAGRLEAPGVSTDTLNSPEGVRNHNLEVLGESLPGIRHIKAIVANAEELSPVLVFCHASPHQVLKGAVDGLTAAKEFFALILAKFFCDAIFCAIHTARKDFTKI